MPLLQFFAVHPVFHYDNYFLPRRRALFFYLLQHVDDVPGRTVIEATHRPAVSLAELGGSKVVAVDGRTRDIVGLCVEGRPAEIPRGDETRIRDCPQLEGEQQDGNEGPHFALPVQL